MEGEPPKLTKEEHEARAAMMGAVYREDTSTYVRRVFDKFERFDADTLRYLSFVELMYRLKYNHEKASNLAQGE